MAGSLIGSDECWFDVGWKKKKQKNNVREKADKISDGKQVTTSEKMATIEDIRIVSGHLASPFLTPVEKSEDIVRRTTSPPSNPYEKIVQQHARYMTSASSTLSAKNEKSDSIK